MYLPDIFTAFLEQHPDIAEALRSVGSLCASSGPIDQKTQHLIQLGVSVGIASKGAVRSHTRRALETGATQAEIIQTVLLSATIIGFPGMIAAYGWVQEVFAAKEAE